MQKRVSCYQQTICLPASHSHLHMQLSTFCPLTYVKLPNVTKCPVNVGKWVAILSCCKLSWDCNLWATSELQKKYLKFIDGLSGNIALPRHHRDPILRYYGSGDLLPNSKGSILEWSLRQDPKRAFNWTLTISIKLHIWKPKKSGRKSCYPLVSGRYPITPVIFSADDLGVSFITSKNTKDI